MTKAFDFEDAGRRYSCCVEVRRTVPPESWWWFSVSGDQNRYAPFRAAAGDTKEAVKTRIVEYYVDRLERRAQAVEVRPHWSQRAKTAAVTPTPPPPQG